MRKSSYFASDGEGGRGRKRSRFFKEGTSTADYELDDCGARAGPPPVIAGSSCPRCSLGMLVARDGRFGPFFGCSAFPECRHVVPIAERPSPKKRSARAKVLSERHLICLRLAHASACSMPRSTSTTQLPPPRRYGSRWRLLIPYGAGAPTRQHSSKSICAPHWAASLP